MCVHTCTRRRRNNFIWVVLCRVATCILRGDIRGGCLRFSGELFFFGGEHYDGQKVRVYNESYKFSIDKKTWRRILSPETPKARCSHQAVFYKYVAFVLWIYFVGCCLPTQFINVIFFAGLGWCIITYGKLVIVLQRCRVYIWRGVFYILSVSSLQGLVEVRFEDQYVDEGDRRACSWCATS